MSRPLLRRILTVLVVVIVGFTALALVINAFAASRSGPTSSSYATAADGLAAYARLLERAGHPVTRLRATPARAQLAPSDTLVLLDPNVLVPDDGAALRTFVSGGGELIAGGAQPGAWLAELLPGPPTWSSHSPGGFAPLLPMPENAGVSFVESAGPGSWSNPGATLPTLGAANASLLTMATLGHGRIALLADASPLQNRLLAHADNAALGTALAGAPGRPVVFEEGVHGYGQHTGLAALPTRWKWALIGLLLAALAFVAARIRRLGPPQPPSPSRLPARREHAQALAAALRRTKKPGAAAATVQQHARELVLRGARLGEDASGDQVRAAAETLGLERDEARVVAAPNLADDDVLIAGRVLAKLAGGRR